MTRGTKTSVTPPRWFDEFRADFIVLVLDACYQECWSPASCPAGTLHLLVLVL